MSASPHSILKLLVEHCDKTLLFGKAAILPLHFPRLGLEFQLHLLRSHLQHQWSQGQGYINIIYIIQYFTLFVAFYNIL